MTDRRASMECLVVAALVVFAPAVSGQSRSAFETGAPVDACDAPSGRAADSELPALLAMAKDGRPATRLAAIAALGGDFEIASSPPDRRAAALALFEGLDDPEPAVRIQALLSLVQLGGWDYDPAHARRMAGVSRELAGIAAGRRSDAALHRALGTVYLLNGELDLAAEALEISLTADPGGHSARYLLGVARLGQGRFLDAGGLFKQVPPDDPYYPNAQEQLKQVP